MEIRTGRGVPKLELMVWMASPEGSLPHMASAFLPQNR